MNVTAERVIQQRVLAGIDFLDQRIPDWRGRIDLSRFKISSRYLCVFGQLAGVPDVAVIDALHDIWSFPVDQDGWVTCGWSRFTEWLYEGDVDQDDLAPYGFCFSTQDTEDEDWWVSGPDHWEALQETWVAELTRIAIEELIDLPVPALV